MKKLLFILGLWLAGVTIAPAYTQTLDNLYAAYINTKESERRDTGNDLVKWLDEQGYAIDSVLYDKNLPDSDFDLKMTLALTRYLFRAEYYSEAFEAGQRLTRLSEAANDSTSLIVGYYFMGFANQRMGNMYEGLLYAQKCYDLSLARNDEEMLSSVLNNMGNIYMVNGQDSLAIVYFKQTLDIERRLGRMQNLATRLGNIASAYIKLDKAEEALPFAAEGLEIDRREGRPDKLAIRLHQIGEVYTALEDFAQARKYELEALDYFIKAESEYGQAIILNALGEIEDKLQNERQAIQYMEQALQLAESIQNNLLAERIYNNLYKVYKANNPAKALPYYERYTHLKDSIFHSDNQKQLNEFQVKYDTQQKELEVARQKVIISRQNATRTILIVGLTLTIIIILLVWRMLWLRIKRNHILAEMNATKDKFFNIISHDLKNPAIAQHNALQMLLNQGSSWDAGLRTKYYEELLKSSDGQIELLHNLLNWAQVQTNRMPFTPIKFDIAAVLRTEVEMVENMAKMKEISFVVQIPDEALVYGDKIMCGIIIRNLLTNAIKFTGRGGKISLTVTSVDTNYSISISDTGIGLSKEQISSLFRIDRRNLRNGTAGEQGSGLGLIVCKELVEKHGSRLEVESIEGKGCKFRFSVPK